MKKIINKLKSNLLFTFIISGIIFGSIGIYAASLYYAKDVQYEPTDETWEVSNVSEAIDSLYSMKEELNILKNLGDATADDIAIGKTALVNGKLITGTNINDNTNTFKYEVVKTTTSTTTRKINLKNEYKSMEYCFVIVNIDSNRKDTFSGSSISFSGPNSITCSTPTVSGSYSTTVIFVGN